MMKMVLSGLLFVILLSEINSEILKYPISAEFSDEINMELEFKGDVLCYTLNKKPLERIAMFRQSSGKYKLYFYRQSSPEVKVAKEFAVSHDEATDYILIGGKYPRRKEATKALQSAFEHVLHNDGEKRTLSKEKIFLTDETRAEIAKNWVLGDLKDIDLHPIFILEQSLDSLSQN
eukprot:c8160_g1_i1.p1 GENE.c8160_g1_i1~~c8160_g1_i1.p1  ORF type:complete len:183 (+),score=68.65 c8160_g1_i1:23-550(+)